MSSERLFDLEPEIFTHTGRRARIAEVNCTKMHFDPGDRILVKLKQPIGVIEERKLRRTVEKWAGDGIEILIIDTTKMGIEFERFRELRVSGE